MSDEKWLYGNSVVTLILTLTLTLIHTNPETNPNPNKGLAARTFAKACESLGIEKQAFSCHNKGHISKVIFEYVNN
jgi:hypothetical protein